MSELSHLDELEAEAIYIIREVAAECEKLSGGFRDSLVSFHYGYKSGNESFLSGETSISVFARKHDMEI